MRKTLSLTTAILAVFMSYDVNANTIADRMARIAAMRAARNSELQTQQQSQEFQSRQSPVDILNPSISADINGPVPPVRPHGLEEKSGEIPGEIPLASAGERGESINLSTKVVESTGNEINDLSSKSLFDSAHNEKIVVGNIGELESRISALESALNEEKNAKSKADEMITKLATEKDSLDKQIEEFRAKIDEMAEEIRDHQRIKLDDDNEIQRLGEENINLNTKLSEAENQLRVNGQTNADLNTKLSDVENQLRVLELNQESKMKIADEKYDELEAEYTQALNQFGAEIEGLNQALEDAQKEKETSSVEVTRLTSELNNVKQALEDAQKKNEAFNLLSHDAQVQQAKAELAEKMKADFEKDKAALEEQMKTELSKARLNARNEVLAYLKNVKSLPRKVKDQYSDYDWK